MKVLFPPHSVFTSSDNPFVTVAKAVFCMCLHTWKKCVLELEVLFGDSV